MNTRVFTFRSIQKRKWKTKKLPSGAGMVISPISGDIVTAGEGYNYNEVEKTVKDVTGLGLEQIDPTDFKKEHGRKYEPFQCYRMVAGR